MAELDVVRIVEQPVSNGIAAGMLAESPLRFHMTPTAEIAYRQVGSGPPLLLLHGWPLSGLTYRRLIPHLAPRFTCYAVDLPGGGETRWRTETDFSFGGQAETVARFIAGLGLNGCHVVAHDTGATIARALALTAGEHLSKLVLIGTEIPGHRPPWIPLYQRLTALPGAQASFRLLMSSQRFLRSPMGFGNCFVDRSLIGGEFSEYFVRPLVQSSARLEGQLRYLGGIDWAFLDRLAEEHRKITNPVLLIWGADDSIFPVQRARAMTGQLGDCRGFVAIAGAKLLVHEERPAEVAQHILEFLLA
jgi:pimeloyl-ACP methyl ester carboxylesterase